MKKPTCPDCKTAMSEGWLIDATYGGVVPSRWHDKKPESITFLGIPAGAKAKPGHTMNIVAWRCPDCGLLKTYAHPKKWNKVT